MSNSVRPHRWQPTRLPHPWDFPGKNTGVGCHFLLQRMKVKRESEIAQPCPTLRIPMHCSLPGSSVHTLDFPGKSTGVGCHRLLRNITIHFTLFCIPLDKSLTFMYYRKKYGADGIKPSFICSLSFILYICPINNGYD